MDWCTRTQWRVSSNSNYSNTICSCVIRILVRPSDYTTKCVLISPVRYDMIIRASAIRYYNVCWDEFYVAAPRIMMYYRLNFIRFNSLMTSSYWFCATNDTGLINYFSKYLVFRIKYHKNSLVLTSYINIKIIFVYTMHILVLFKTLDWFFFIYLVLIKCS